MTLARKKINEVIDNGGAVKADSQPSKNYKVLCQRVRLDMLEQVNIAVAKRAGMNRNAWIQEAIQEKLERIKDVNQD